MSTRLHDALHTSGLEDIASRLERSGSELATSVDMGIAKRVDLSCLAIIDVTGEDAAEFLQGQLCNDLTLVTPTQAQFSGYCSPKGRLLALLIVTGIDQGFRLILPTTVCAGFIKRLSMFVLRAKVTINERQDLLCSGFLTESTGVTDALPTALGELPEQVMSAVTGDQAQVVRWRDSPAVPGRARYLILTNTEVLCSWWRQDPELPVATEAAWRLADIQAGVASIQPATVDAFVPQMVNLHLIDGLSFRKGCYPGQEIVARMHYLGKLKRHMCVHVSEYPWPDEVSLPIAGAAVVAEDRSEAGMVVDAVKDSDGRVWMLVVEKVLENAERLFVAEQSFTRQSLPYELPTLSKAQQSAG